MALKLFHSFQSTVTPFRVGQAVALLKILEDPTTGAPVGIQSPRGNGPDGIWTPIDVTAAQIASPPASMVADLNAVYRLNVAPYTRYQSDGTALVGLGGAQMDVVPADGIFGTIIIWSPFTVSQPDGVTIRGTVHVRAVSA